jgi:hypothetical protein
VVEGNVLEPVSFPSGDSEFAQGGKSVKLGLLWAWKFKLERLKGEVERALHSVYEGLDLFGPGEGWAPEKAILKPKPKTQPKSVKLRSFRLLCKPKPISKRLDLATDLEPVCKPKILYSKLGVFSGSDEGCGARAFPTILMLCWRWFRP